MSNVLIIKHGSLGDIAQASGVIQDIFEYHREDKIYLLTVKQVILVQMISVRMMLSQMISVQMTLVLMILVPRLFMQIQYIQLPIHFLEIYIHLEQVLL